MTSTIRAKSSGTWLSKGLLIASIMVGASLAQAAPPPGSAPPPHGPAGFVLGFGPHFDHLLADVGATDAQRAQIKQITDAAQADLKAQRQSGKALHEQGLDLFAQATVDAGALETLRQNVQALHDAESKRVTQEVYDISQVLTPAQRQAIATKIKEFEAAPHRAWHPGK